MNLGYIKRQRLIKEAKEKGKTEEKKVKINIDKLILN